MIEIKPDIKPSYALDRLWLRATAPDFKTIDIKVNKFKETDIGNYGMLVTKSFRVRNKGLFKGSTTERSSML